MKSKSKPVSLAAICITTALLLLPIILMSNTRLTVFHLLDKHNTYANLPEYSRAELEAQFNTILAYLTPPFQQELDPEFFSQEDILHMHDVQVLFIWVYLIVFLGITGGIGLALIYQLSWRQIIAVTIKVITLFITSSIALAALALIFWEQAFLAFHQVMFPLNSYWQLDPATSRLVRFLPEVIFQELVMRLLLFWIVILSMTAGYRLMSILNLHDRIARRITLNLEPIL